MSDWSTLKEARPLHSMNTPAEVSCSNGILEIYSGFPANDGGCGVPCRGPCGSDGKEGMSRYCVDGRA